MLHLEEDLAIQIQEMIINYTPGSCYIYASSIRLQSKDTIRAITERSCKKINQQKLRLQVTAEREREAVNSSY
uniref:Uncharacterized protein n=1 Tax=Arundo donax TaxID=35708 RepID=A0A0A9B5N2_ARUDO